MDVVQHIGSEQGIDGRQVAAVLALLSEGSTVPFIARYRKERTGGLDEVKIRDIAERFEYLTELGQRRDTILDSIKEQGKLTPELAKRIEAAVTKTELEDLYLPYKKKKKTRALLARERGLEPLAERMLAQTDADGDPSTIAAEFVDAAKQVADAEAALAGARDIIAERVAENADYRAWIRKTTFSEGRIHSTLADEKKKAKAAKFEKYFDHSEGMQSIPSHRFLAIRRGEKEGYLKVQVETKEDKILAWLEKRALAKAGSIWSDSIKQAVADAYRRLMAPSIANDLLGQLKRGSDEVAIEVFAANLRNLLLASPLGGKRILAIDPGFRTGCKVVVLDETGKLLDHDTIFPHPPQNEVEAARKIVDRLVDSHKVEAIAIGNGTAGRESDKFIADYLAERRKTETRRILRVMVNESGASVYSASPLAREELPDLDVSVRGAVSIGRRLQDPLAELVKIDPRSIGVGQYQHDVNQSLLKKKLDFVIESSVNFVGVDVNRASGPLLAHVSGIGPALAKRIVKYRDENGAFPTRDRLQKVPLFGPKAFEQAAGFLRIPAADNPLDNSAVHPERYHVVRQMARDLGMKLDELVGNAEAVGRIEPEKYVDDDLGMMTLEDILAELVKPGRDPRQEFTTPGFREDVNEIGDLQIGMILDGVITNVTNFGAFVDIGVHQDGLVHVSELSHEFISDPKEKVKVGDRLKVQVIGVDADHKRISLSAKATQPAPEGVARPAGGRPRKGRPPKADGKAASGGRPKGGGGKGGGGKGKKRRPPHRAQRDERPRSRRNPDTSLGALLGDALKDALKEENS